MTNDAHQSSEKRSEAETIDPKKYEGPLRHGRYFLHQGGDTRTILTIKDKDVAMRVGTYDMIYRNLFPKVFNGTRPMWTSLDPGVCLIEMPSNSRHVPFNGERLNAFLDAIDEAYDESLRPKVSEMSAPSTMEATPANTIAETRANLWQRMKNKIGW